MSTLLCILVATVIIIFKYETHSSTSLIPLPVFITLIATCNLIDYQLPEKEEIEKTTLQHY